MRGPALQRRLHIDKIWLLVLLIVSDRPACTKAQPNTVTSSFPLLTCTLVCSTNTDVYPASSCFDAAAAKGITCTC